MVVVATALIIFHRVNWLLHAKAALEEGKTLGTPADAHAPTTRQVDIVDLIEHTSLKDPSQGRRHGHEDRQQGLHER